MRNLYSLLLFVLSLSLSGQVMNQTVTDCNSTTKSIHGVLGTGKVLVIISTGLDCSICMGQAAGHQNWAAQNTSDAEVWGAMTYRYNGNTPQCSDLSSWISTYGWNDIFTFIDSSRSWFQTGTPRFYVYDPRDSSLAYEGFQSAAAFSAAQVIINDLNSVGITTPDHSDFEVASYQGRLEITNWAGKANIRLISITGKSVVSKTSSDKIKKINTTGLKPGIYLLSIDDGNGYQQARKIYIQ